MPEYLAPGVFVEEVSFRAKTIEGVSTSTAGFIGPARYGPTSGVPELITSFGMFEQIYGNADQLVFEGDPQPTHNFLAHAVRAFFENGGQRLYISRVYSNGGGPPFASLTLPISSLPPARGLTLQARYAGRGGNLVYVFTLKIDPNALIAVPTPTGSIPAVRGLAQYDLVYIAPTGSLPGQFGPGELFWAERRFDPLLNRNTWSFHAQNGGIRELDTIGAVAGLNPLVDNVLPVSVDVSVTYPGREQRTDVWEDVAFHPAHQNSIARVFGTDLASRMKELTVPLVITTTAGMEGPEIANILFPNLQPTDNDRVMTYPLTLASDGVRPSPTVYAGSDTDPRRKDGLKVFEDIAEISIAAAPGATYNGNTAAWRTQAIAITGSLITHCEKMKYRIAVVEAPDQQALSEVMDFRAKFDTTHAALYYPWVRVLDPVTELEINLPPAGFVAGIYARNDIEKGVHKAPANEVVRGAVTFEFLINRAQQEVLNPLGINCFRFLDNRGYRLWGARLMTSDGEWRYVNLRRYFAYLERSIERGTQFAVFENNGDLLWANVRRTVEDFLFNEWKSGRLFGEKVEDAYFVRCDRSTMTQNDIDSGRLICLVGVAPLRPAEFVIFRIGQWVAPRRG